MAKNLLIVESPAKAKTIEKILGKDFEVKSCYGHIRDLEKDAMGIDVNNHFEPRYIVPADKEKVVKDLQQMRAYGHVHSEHDKHEHTEALPEANDEFAKSFGAFQNMSEMRDKIKDNLMKEAEHATHDKKRIVVMENIINETSFDVPEIVLKSEQEKMYATIESDISHNGGTMEEYLKHIKKNREELMEEFKPESEKRARFQLLINAIAKEEKIVNSEEEITKEAEKMVVMYPGADLARAKAYADMVMLNEKVLSMLEGK